MKSKADHVLFQVDVNIPQVQEDKDRGQASVQASEMPIPFRSIRLVYPLPDPDTGIPRDVIINGLTARYKHFDVFENKQVFERWMEPQHIRIPWPEKKEDNFVDEAEDTLRVETEKQTFLPTLMIPPMPDGIIDELRNKYSRYRDRHDDEYVARKEAEDAAEEAERLRQQASLPRGARNVARVRSTGRRDPDNVLSDAIAARIGRHMAASGAGPKAHANTV